MRTSWGLKDLRNQWLEHDGSAQGDAISRYDYLFVRPAQGSLNRLLNCRAWKLASAEPPNPPMIAPALDPAMMSTMQ